jgi:hypothetical protein
MRAQGNAREQTESDSRPLPERHPVGQFSRRLDARRAARLGAVVRELCDGETVDTRLSTPACVPFLLFAPLAGFSTAKISSPDAHEQ